ncbi:MAG: hypothetical protein J2P45_05575 [Candidatus Dormibacteraeota bacterium]|nr:hypothetical protein [Candidatus Dormibacteraeota bacterium]
MAERTWTLHSPLGSPRPPEPVAARRSAGAALGFLSNHKPNAAELERALAKQLARERPGLEARFYEKRAASLAAPPELLDRIAAECGLAVNASAD